MNKLLQKVKDIQKDGCVTIIMNTHRTKPENEKDSIQLKNLVSKAEERLYEEFDKRDVWPIMEQLNQVIDKIERNYHLESLVVCANADFADYTRLAVEVEDRVVVDDNFATRDLIRSLQQNNAYYVLALNKHKVRLIEAFNDKLLKEWGKPFPLDNYLYTTDTEKLSHGDHQDRLTEEFFNRSDKELWENTKEHRLPVIVAADSRNHEHYMKVCDHPDGILGHIRQFPEDTPAYDIVQDAWQEVHSIYNKKNEERMAELRQAVSQNKYFSDINDIWKGIQNGRGATLFVRKGFFQPGIIKDNRIELVDQEKRTAPNFKVDIIDEMIEANRSFGGDTVFIENEAMEDFQNVALITRY